MPTYHSSTYDAVILKYVADEIRFNAGQIVDNIKASLLVCFIWDISV